jgi:hypothetical protein
MKKTLSIVAVAILVGLGTGAALANDSGENHQDNTNTTGFNPYMPELGAPASPGRSAFASYPVHHTVTHHVKKETSAPSAQR